MKRILIVGKGSYIGTSFERWLAQWPELYQVDTVDTLNDCWREHSFSGYDSVLHVAGIAHVKERPILEDLYYKVNRDLAIEVANKAKNSGVKQFILMSSMAVYGEEGSIKRPVEITEETLCNPKTLYGKSKYEAEKEIQLLQSSEFSIAVVRAPMIYGPNCPGNYSKLRLLVLKSSLLPSIKSTRSMIFIDNLCEFFRIMVDCLDGGLFYPQNSEYVSIDELVRNIALYNNKRIKLSSLLGVIISVIGYLPISLINKAFGSLTYNISMSGHYSFNYCITNFKESIKTTEEKWCKQN